MNTFFTFLGFGGMFLTAISSLYKSVTGSVEETQKLKKKKEKGKEKED